MTFLQYLRDVDEEKGADVNEYVATKDVSASEAIVLFLGSILFSSGMSDASCVE